MNTKTCNTCGEIKDKSLFPRKRNMCKVCKNKESREWFRFQRENKTEIAIKLLAYQRAYRKKQKEENPDKYKLITKQLHWKYREHSLARYKFRGAVVSGKLKKLPCQECGDLNVDGHHEDYSKPLEVIWLCRKHHAKKHPIYKN
jgi:hypothetical protein